MFQGRWLVALLALRLANSGPSYGWYG